MFHFGKKNDRFLKRMVVSKGLGLFFGLLGFFFIMRVLGPESTSHLQWGILLWYATFGAIIGISGIFDRHPYFGFPMPFYFRGAFLGAWLNFVLAVFLLDEMSEIMIASGFPENISPLVYAPLEGAALGILIDWAATKWGGEGKNML